MHLVLGTKTAVSRCLLVTGRWA